MKSIKGAEQGDDWHRWVEGRESTWYTKELNVAVGAPLCVAWNCRAQ